jgi:hypothetical protein
MVNDWLRGHRHTFDASQGSNGLEVLSSPESG